MESYGISWQRESCRICLYCGDSDTIGDGCVVNDDLGGGARAMMKAEAFLWERLQTMMKVADNDGRWN